MKRFCLIVMAASCSLLARAQTNTTGTLPTARGPTLISSASADFDLAGHEAIYHGNVRVDDPQMKLACEQLIADVPQAGGHVSHIVAETNVVIDFTDNKGQTNHATGDKAVYVYQEQGGVTNETITLTGNPQMENAQGTMAGDVIVWDRQNNHLSALNQRMIFRQNLSGGMTDTNSAPPKSAPAKTNSPPGAAESSDPLMQ
jgi:lipopolysaccharide transport protein LptA